MPSFTPDNLPPLDEAQKARLDTAAAMPDSETDYNNTPFSPAANV